MNLIDINKLNTVEVIEKLSQEFSVEELVVKYWRNEECREVGIAHSYSHDSKNLQGMIYEAKKLIDRDGFAAVEVIAIDECGEEDTVYFYDGVTEKLLYV